MPPFKRLFLITVIGALAAFSIQRLHLHSAERVVLMPTTFPKQQRAVLPAVNPVRLVPSSPPVNREMGFYASNNYFDFVSKNAKSAFEGDGRAALYISKALQICMPIIKSYGDSSDPESAFNAEWVAKSNAPQWLVDKARKDFHACLGFFKGDAFASLPTRDGGYNSKGYWLDQAYKDNDPIALVFHAVSEINKVNPSKSADMNSVSMQGAQFDINNAVASGDPAALFMVGNTISNGRGADPLQGFAVSIAACNLGYDCSVDNNEEYFGACIAASTCPPGITYADIVTQAVGSNGYAQAYARAQRLEDAMSRGDMGAVQQFVQLQPPS